MPFRIRTKLLIAFMNLIFFIMMVGGLVGYYAISTSHRALHKVEAVAEEIIVVGNLQHSIEHVLMPANDYLITGDRKYRDDFNTLSKEVEERLRRSEELLGRLEAFGLSRVERERKSLKDVKTAWQNIRDISLKVFDIPNPVGNKDGARMMEDMDYRWGGPATEVMQKWHEWDIEEYKEAIESAEKAKTKSWIIMASAATLLLILGAGFTAFYSKLFVRPIESIHKGADAIAAGNFKTRLDIKTGDEVEQLSNAMNEMAEQLDIFTSNLQGMVEERTRDLKIERDMAQTYLDVAGVIFIVIDASGKVTLVNKRGAEVLGCPEGEINGKSWFDNFLPEKVRDDIRGIFRRLMNGENGSLEYVENPVLTCSGEERIVAWHNTVLKDEAGNIIATLSSGEDITERKKAEDALKQRVNELEQFRKVTIKRELRIEELQRKVEEMEKKLMKL